MQYKFLFWVGILVLALPFLGVPQSWKHFLLFCVGVVLIAAALLEKHHQTLEELEGTDEAIFEESDEVFENPEPAFIDGVVPPQDNEDEGEDEDDDDWGEGDEDDEDEKEK